MMFALRQMMSLSLMMTASPNDVASLMFWANIASLRVKRATSYLRSKCIISPQAMHHFPCPFATFMLQYTQGDDLMNTNVRIRRIIAWIIDWNLSGLPCLLYTTIFMDVFKRPSFQNIGYILIFMLLVFLYPVTFVFRDVIFKGRSIGKRIFGLYVLDKNTNEPASIKQRIIRNLFFFIYPVDGIILIVTKESIGDKAVNTTVVKK